MAEVLKLFEFIKDDEMAESEVWSGWIDAEFDAQGFICG